MSTVLQPLTDAAVGKCKGAMLHTIVQVYRQLHGAERLAEVLARTSPQFTSLANAGFTPSQWYPEHLLVRWYRAAAPTMSDEQQIEFGFAMQRRMLTGIYRLGVLLSGPERALQFARRGHGLYMTNGKVGVAEIGSRHWELRYEDLALINEPGFLLGLEGAYRALLTVAQASEPAVCATWLRSGSALVDIAWKGAT